MYENICNRWVSTPVQERLEKDGERVGLEQRWLELTCTILPGMAKDCHWPISQNHCFQRVLLDAACEGRWYDRIVGRPAYKAASGIILARAVALGEQIRHDAECLPQLNLQSLRYRGKL